MWSPSPVGDGNGTISKLRFGQIVMTRCQATISYRPMGGDLSGGGARGSSGQATPVENRRALVLRGRCTPAFSRPLTPFHRAAEMMRTGPTRRGRQVNYGAVLYCF